jgi:hypothetical protein
LSILCQWNLRALNQIAPSPFFARQGNKAPSSANQIEVILPSVINCFCGQYKVKMKRGEEEKEEKEEKSRE